MLDSETRRRIDTARDILVGKVPDPKSQVEQITIALIYKFMDDMDAEAEELGGRRSFFVGEYEKFGWAKLMSPSLGGFEVLNLYSEAIDKMTRNEGVPQLFRDIFKNAYLPYRDPETLKLFLKTINEFTYDHSERLGDAFEYLLSVLGSQGEAGQFRTPRHIIDFMVKVVNPQKDESILDPACGTAGFLISAYKHVMASNAKEGRPGAALKPAERKKLADNIRGYDISPDMVRLSLVNMYLHGFSTPNIYEYDTLTSEERWNEYADVILANPPFMSPKGGIKPHKRFSVQSNRSEVLFVDYMAEHLTPNGRAAIIVPEGIIFQSAGAYKQLRKYLIEHNYLWAVISLPAGVFNPYAGVKTSILFLDKALARKTDQILFVKVEADGFDLGAQRRLIDRNDLPQTLKVLQDYQQTLKVSETFRVLTVSKSRLAENEDYNLSADRYREVTRVGKQTYPLVKLGDVFETSSGGTPLRSKNEYYEGGTIPWVKSGEVAQGFVTNTEEKITELGLKNSSAKIFPANTVLVAMYGATAGQVGLLKIEATTNQAVCGIYPNDKVIPEYLYQTLKSKTDYMISLGSGGAQPNISQSIIRNLEIPLPPLEIQHQIVDEIAAHQRIIDGARQVVEGWKPSFEISEEWDYTTIDDICTVKGGKRLPKGETYAKDKTNHPYIRVVDLIGGSVDTSDLRYITEDIFKEVKNYTISSDDVYISIAGTIGLLGTVPDELNGANLTENAAKLVLQKNKVDKHFLKYVGMSDFAQQQIKKLTHAVGVPKLALERIRTIQIPLPPLEAQREIVARIERERAIVEGNRELIRIYQEKVKKVIERVWEG